MDRLELRGRCTVSALDLDAVLDLGKDGHVAEIQVEEGAWSLTVRVDGPAQPAVDAEGSSQDALTAAQIADLGHAIEQSDALAALRIIEKLSCTVRMVIRNDPSACGAHWIDRKAELERLLMSERWHATAVTLATQPRILVIGDAGAASLLTGGLSVQGPEVTNRAERPPVLDDVTYRQRGRQDGRPNLPSPALFASDDDDDAAVNALQMLALRFNGVARCLVWYWLAAEVQLLASGRVEVTFSGARTVTLALAPSELDSAQADLALYAWAVTGNDPARGEAIQHAASLAVTSAADLATAATPALRTARSLYELSRRTAISEALTASRSAREATLNATRQAADTARQTAGKTVERALLQMAAAAAVVLTNARNLLGTASAALLLLLVVALSMTSLAVALHVELSSAGNALDAELDDLEQYRDVLASDDIAAVRGIKVVAAARAALRRGRHTTISVYLGTAVAVLLVGGLLIFNHQNEVARTQTPTQHGTQTSTSPTTSAR